MKHLRIVIESELGNVPLASVAVNGICAHLGMDAIEAGHMELCVAEAATNSIRHAYHGVPGHEVLLDVSAGSDHIQIEVCDRGTPMSPQQAHELVHGKKAFEFDPIDRCSIPEGGRGLLIIHALMDQLAYTREGDLNRLTMRKQLPMRTQHSA